MRNVTKAFVLLPTLTWSERLYVLSCLVPESDSFRISVREQASNSQVPTNARIRYRAHARMLARKLAFGGIRVLGESGTSF